MSNDINPYNAGPRVAPGAPPAVGDVREVVYELDVNDLIAFSLYHHKKSPAIRRQRRTAFLLLPAVLFGMSSLLLVTERNAGLSTIAFVGFAGGAVLFLLGPWLTRRRTAHILARIYAEGSNRALLGWRRLSIGPACVAMNSDLIESRMKWPAIEKIDATNEYLFIYFGSANAHIVPMRAFGDEAHFRSFVETARRYWKQARDTMGPTA